jgi:hypothetical protein
MACRIDMMRIRERHLGLYAALACLVGFITVPLQADDNELNWLGDYHEALRLARQANKPVFLEFRCEA